MDHELTDQYNAAKRAIADLLAAQKGKPVSVTEWNEANGILWPHLTDDLRSALVLR